MLPGPPYARPMTTPWAGWLEGRMAALGLSATALSAAAGVPDSMVSRWRRQGVRPEVAQLRRLAAPLQVELLDLLVASGHLTEQEALRPAPPAHPGWDDAKKALGADPDVDPDLRELLLVQYEAMRTLTASRRIHRRSERLITLGAQALATAAAEMSAPLPGGPAQVPPADSPPLPEPSSAQR